jgi:hypothetical protein
MSRVKGRELGIIFGSIIFVALCLTIMALMHERHYRKRGTIIDPSKAIEERIAAIESILTEDRFT